MSRIVHRFSWLAAPLLAVMAHCSSSPGEEGQPPLNDGGIDAESGFDAPIGEDGALPRPDAPRGVAFRDRDPRAGFVEGTITIDRATDESLLDGYGLYWTNAAGARLGEVGSVAKSTTPLALALAAGTVAPAGATLLAAVGKKATVESAALTTKGDNFPVHVDIGANAGSDYLLYSRILVDTTNQKLLLVGQDASIRPTLRRCALDGSQCTSAVLDAGRGPQTGWFLSPAIDIAAKKLLVVFQDETKDGRAGLFRCNLDGTACTYADISAGQAASSGHSPVALVDAVAKKLIVVAQNDAIGKLGFVRCELDGTACVTKDVSAGEPPASGRQPSAILDTVNGKLLVVTNDSTGRSSLFRCATDGTACTHTDVSAGGGINSGSSPNVTIDTASSKLLIVTQDNSDGASPRHLAFVRCELDGTACARTELGGTLTAMTPQVLVRSTEMLVLSADSAAGHPMLRRCALDGTGCTAEELSTSPAVDGTDPTMALDPVSGKLLVGATADDRTPVLYRYSFDGSPIVRKDLSAGPGSQTGFIPSAFQDPATGSLSVVTEADVRGVHRLLLFRCGPDGSACTFTNLSSGNDRWAAGDLAALYDPAAKKLLVVFNDDQNSKRPSLLRCEPSGAGCVYVDISAGAPASTGSGAVATIDATNGKLLVVTAGSGNGVRPALFRCDLDGTGCTFTDLFPGGPLVGGPRNLLTVGGKLTFMVRGASPNPTFVRCELDGTACAWHALDSGPGSSNIPYATVDGTKLVVVAGPSLFRCELDGTACTYRDVSTGQPAGAGGAAVVVDTVAKKLLLVNSDSALRSGPSLLRCEPDGSSCIFVDLSAGQGRTSGTGPRPLFDATRNRLLVVTTNGANLMRPGLFSLDGW